MQTIQQPLKARTIVAHFCQTSSPRTLDQVIVQLRKKLGDNNGEPQHLLTVNGIGYKLAC